MKEIKTQAELDALVAELNKDNFPYIGPVGSVILLPNGDIRHKYDDDDDIIDTQEELAESIYSYYHDC
jgi:hypothetical protein